MKNEKQENKTKYKGILKLASGAGAGPISVGSMALCKVAARIWVMIVCDMFIVYYMCLFLLDMLLNRTEL